jgi:hypothetical protein
VTIMKTVPVGGKAMLIVKEKGDKTDVEMEKDWEKETEGGMELEMAKGNLLMPIRMVYVITVSNGF